MARLYVIDGRIIKMGSRYYISMPKEKEKVARELHGKKVTLIVVVDDE